MGRKKNPGKPFEKEVRLSLQHFNNTLGRGKLFYHRYSDYRTFMPVRRSLGDPEEWEVPKQPADWQIMYMGIGRLIEAKSSKKPASFGLSKTMDEDAPFFHQLEAMRRFEQGGGLAELLICNRIPRKNVVYVVPLPTFMNILKRAEREGKKSVKWDYFKKLRSRKLVIILREKKEKIWDFDFLRWWRVQYYYNRQGINLPEKFVRKLKEMEWKFWGI